MTQQLVPIAPQQIHAIPVGEFHDPGFWKKIKRVAVRLTRDGLEHALMLYYAAQQPETPKWAKATVYGALAYFVLPIDSIPDITPAIGYSDDLLVLTAAVSTIAAHINDEVRLLAHGKLNSLIGQV